MEKGFHMKKRKSRRGTILIIGLAILALVSAMRYIPEKDINEEKISETAAINTSKEIYLEKDAALKLKTVYNCGHIKTETREIDENLIGKTKEEVLQIHPDWVITEFTSDLISAEQPVESPCENHFFIKLEGDTLHVYKKNNLSESIKEQKINISALSQKDIKELEAGINAETEFEVLEIMESFVS